LAHLTQHQQLIFWCLPVEVVAVHMAAVVVVVVNDQQQHMQLQLERITR
jgi:hypothetical protein